MRSPPASFRWRLFPLKTNERKNLRKSCPHTTCLNIYDGNSFVFYPEFHIPKNKSAACSVGVFLSFLIERSIDGFGRQHQFCSVYLLQV